MPILSQHPKGRGSVDTLASAVLSLSPEPASPVHLGVRPEAQPSGSGSSHSSLPRRDSVETVQENWYHGLIARAEAESRLGTTEHGTFLVRYSESTESYILSQR